MFTIKQKNGFRTLCGILVALLMLILSANVSGAHHGRGKSERSDDTLNISSDSSERGHSRSESKSFDNTRTRFSERGRHDSESERSDDTRNRGPRFFERGRDGSKSEGFVDTLKTGSDSFERGRHDSKSERSDNTRPRFFERGHGSSDSERFGDTRNKGPKFFERGRGSSDSERSDDTRNRRLRFFKWNDGKNRFKGFDKGRWTNLVTGLNHDNTTLKVTDSIRGKTNITVSYLNTARTVFIPHNDFVFFDRHRRFRHHRIVRPDFSYFAFFRFGHRHVFRPVFPHYHIKYVFVNPCGYWPFEYRYVRYYWYGCYPYYWYGCNPVPYQYGSDNYNYYTYNYYGGDSTGPVSGSALESIADYNAQQPEPAASADEYFDAGVKAFEAGDFKTAVTKFALARQLAPDDKVLLFAYSQAYFAVGDYSAAAQVLRAALAKVKPLTEGVFYPRGLYSSDDVLLGQIDELGVKASQDRQDTDLQLLLGYQWLGIGELDKAAEPLKNASVDLLNGPPANALLDLLDELQSAKTTEAEAPQDSD